MVNPDVVGAVESDSVTTPDEFGVELGDVDVLDDDVADTVHQAQTLSTQDTRATHANNGLVGGDFQALNTSVVVRAGKGRVATAPVGAILLDGILARAAAGVRGGLAALAVGALALAAEEVELLVDKDDAGGAVGQPSLQLADVARRSRSGITTTSRAASETEGGASDTLRCLDRSSKQGSCRQEMTEESHCNWPQEIEVVDMKGMTEPAVLRKRM